MERNALIKTAKLKMSPRSRVTSLALLCLVAHALFVCTTHHHQSRRDLSAPPGTNVKVMAAGESGPDSQSGSDSHCVSCRLQRNFVSNVHTASVPIEPLQEPVSCETEKLQHAPSGSSLLLFGRAPPLA